MTKKDQLALLLSGAVAWNSWRLESPETFVNLSGADLRGSDLRRYDLSWANLRGADFTGANLNGASTTQSDLGTAALVEADLTQVDLRGASLAHSDLTGAFFWESILGDTRFAQTKGLDACRFRGPCTIDLRTLAHSWPLPLNFLRGCGLPDDYIEYLPSLLARSFEFYSCFISYSTSDEEFAERLYVHLQGKGVRCWFAPHDVRAGRKLHEQIDQAIRFHDKLLLILSQASMASEWVNTEIYKARQREVKEGRRVLFPIRLCEYDELRDWECWDGDTGRDMAREVRGYFVPDFSRWKDHDSYAEAFKRLLRDLKAEGHREASN